MLYCDKAARPPVTGAPQKLFKMSESVPINEQTTGDHRGSGVAEMHDRREMMADGRRYIIYYTFGEQTDPETEEARDDV